MGRVKCCICGMPAFRMVNGKYYCKDCNVPSKEPIPPPKVSTTPICGASCTCNDVSCANSEVVEEPSFWGKVAKWFEHVGNGGIY